VLSGHQPTRGAADDDAETLVFSTQL